MGTSSSSGATASVDLDDYTMVRFKTTASTYLYYLLTDLKGSNQRLIVPSGNSSMCRPISYANKTLTFGQCYYGSSTSGAFCITEIVGYKGEIS